MGSERRQHERIKRPLDATWRGASGQSKCRIGDISLGGCFVHSLAMPRAGELTIVAVQDAEGQMLSLRGHVVYVEPTMGFSLRFEALAPEIVTRLEALLATVAKDSSDLV